jgi:hypothetical protein
MFAISAPSVTGFPQPALPAFTSITAGFPAMIARFPPALTAGLPALIRPAPTQLMVLPVPRMSVRSCLQGRLAHSYYDDYSMLANMGSIG